MNICGKKALVTGGALRIGNAITMKLVESGAEVAVHYNRSETDACELCDLINNDGGKAFPLKMDLSMENAAREIFEELDNRNFIPDILINNASIFESDSILEAQPGAFHRNLDINSLVPLLLSREFAKRTIKGNIINLLDSRINSYDNKHVPYHLSKQMLFSITRMLSQELAPSVRVNAVAPGAVLPPPDYSSSEVDKWLRDVRAVNPLGINGTTEQICSTVEFLIQNDFITGQVIFVDGGRHLQGSFYGI
jgi:NAD(P)-dependent dehydrogenase (short-subunit alcohol dehydrogenase family)